MTLSRKWIWTMTAGALVYSAVHFVQSGINTPLSIPNLGKFEEETSALHENLRTGAPIHLNNPVRYGTVFMLIVQPLLTHTHSDQQLANWLYALQIFCVTVAFLLTWATLSEVVAAREWRLLTVWLSVLWMNFAPVYTTLVVKSVENWELLLVSLGLYAYVRQRLWIMGVAIAAAALIKVLPLIFFYYLLLADRRAFVRAAIALVVLLGIGQAVYGSEMGLWYFPHIAQAVGGNSYGLVWHENLSLKATIVKVFGHLGRVEDGDSPYILTISDEQLRTASLVGDAAVLIGIVLLTWTLLRRYNRSKDSIVWEWSLVSVAMLILSPNTTFEYATLVLGAISYAMVRLCGAGSLADARGRTWVYLGAAMFFLGVFLPRQALNRLTFVAALSRYGGHTYLTPSEAYQYYGFPLLGLVLLVAALWRLRPEPVAAPLTAAV